MDGEMRVMHKVTVGSVTFFCSRLLEGFLLARSPWLPVWDGQDPSDATARLLLLLTRGLFAAIAKDVRSKCTHGEKRPVGSSAPCAGTNLQCVKSGRSGNGAVRDTVSCGPTQW